MAAKPRPPGRGQCAVWLALAVTVCMPVPSSADPTETKPEAAANDPGYTAGKQALDRKDWSGAARRFKRAALRDPENADLQKLGAGGTR